MNSEQKLPNDILNMATIRGNEYAWPPENVLQVISTAKELSLAILGGQFQFRVPEGTCELYWIYFGADDKKKTETWKQYVERSAQECQQTFLETMAKHDLLREGLESFKLLQEYHENGVNLMDYACFVVYVVDESTVTSLND